MPPKVEMRRKPDRLVLVNRRNCMENIRLEQRVRVMEKSTTTSTVELTKDMKHIESGISSMKQTTGKSAEGLPPDNLQDKTHKKSDYFRFGPRISARRLHKWQTKEKELGKFLQCTSVATESIMSDKPGNAKNTVGSALQAEIENGEIEETSQAPSVVNSEPPVTVNTLNLLNRRKSLSCTDVFHAIRTDIQPASSSNSPLDNKMHCKNGTNVATFSVSQWEKNIVRNYTAALNKPVKVRRTFRRPLSAFLPSGEFRPPSAWLRTPRRPKSAPLPSHTDEQPRTGKSLWGIAKKTFVKEWDDTQPSNEGVNAPDLSDDPKVRLANVRAHYSSISKRFAKKSAEREEKMMMELQKKESGLSWFSSAKPEGNAVLQNYFARKFAQHLAFGAFSENSQAHKGVDGATSEQAPPAQSNVSSSEKDSEEKDGNPDSKGGFRLQRRVTKLMKDCAAAETTEKKTIHMALSKSARKRELEQMVTDNTMDVKQIAKKEQSRRLQSRVSMIMEMFRMSNAFGGGRENKDDVSPSSATERSDIPNVTTIQTTNVSTL